MTQILWFYMQVFTCGYDLVDDERLFDMRMVMIRNLGGNYSKKMERVGECLS